MAPLSHQNSLRLDISLVAFHNQCLPHSSGIADHRAGRPTHFTLWSSIDPCIHLSIDMDI
jgi:hypothetical protein